jgi:plastocyanin
MLRKYLVILFAFGVVAAACSSADEDSATEPEPADAEPVEPGVELPDYDALAAEIALAEDDRSLPPDTPLNAIGGYGYSRYVYTTSSGQVVPSLIEGPRGRQVRCQELALDCSYQELKKLLDSGAEIPDYLGMDRATLAELVGQLDRVNAAVMSYDSIADACAAGFVKSTNQNANMGIHMIDPTAGSAATGGEFNPDKPQMVLFAKDGGERLDGSVIGGCADGAWTGEEGYEPVGAVFNLNLTEDHPEGFAGNIDNWHIHYNTCIARDRNLAVEGADMGDGASVTQEQCRNAGGQFIPLIPSWMMHAYVADDFEAQSGVFSMFNPSVWPVLDTETLEASRTVDDPDAVDAPINNFDFGDIQASVGETVRFSNSDSLPHTVTAGSSISPSSLFDSGLLGTGQSFDVSFGEAGDYELFCVLHPDMTATVSVSE